MGFYGVRGRETRKKTAAAVRAGMTDERSVVSSRALARDLFRRSLVATRLGMTSEGPMGPLSYLPALGVDRVGDLVGDDAVAGVVQMHDVVAQRIRRHIVIVILDVLRF